MLWGLEPVSVLCLAFNNNVHLSCTHQCPERVSPEHFRPSALFCQMLYQISYPGPLWVVGITFVYSVIFYKLPYLFKTQPCSSTNSDTYCVFLFTDLLNVHCSHCIFGQFLYTFCIFHLVLFCTFVFRGDIALIGLAVMGQNLILNMNDHGFVVSTV